MTSHFAAIGFHHDGHAELQALVDIVAQQPEHTLSERSSVFTWHGEQGEELWLYAEDGEVVGLEPHFVGRGELAVEVSGRILRSPEYSRVYTLSGTAHGSDIMHPIVFDSPDIAARPELELPFKTTIQLAAFAHSLHAFESPDDFARSQLSEPKFAPNHFVPLEALSTDQPAAIAQFGGVVIEADHLTNSHTGHQFHWALVRSAAGTIDIVADTSALARVPSPGAVLVGEFWLSGTLPR